MTGETLRDVIVDELQQLAWDQWSQLGVSGSPPAQRDERAADPEALVLFTLHVGRTDPRLFDEALDWLARNEGLISQQRLRNLCTGNLDRALADSALEWAMRTRRRGAAAGGNRADQTLVPVFPRVPMNAEDLDPAFARHGLARPVVQRSGKSQPPRMTDPISFAFRLRRLLGVGVRAEVMRTLLTVRASWLSGRMLASSAGFAQRNVREGLTQLVEANVVDVAGTPDDRLYRLNHDAWARVLRLESTPDLPLHYPWIPAYRALTGILNFIQQEGLEDLSPYMRASRARTLIGELAPDLRFAGAPPEAFPAFGADFWTAFEGIARAAVRHARGPQQP